MIKNTRRINHDKEQAKDPQPMPYWVEAFMILLLYKTGGQLTVSLADLERFGKLKKNNHTLLSSDPDNKTVTIRAPEIKLPERIVTAPKQKVITELN